MSTLCALSLSEENIEPKNDFGLFEPPFWSFLSFSKFSIKLLVLSIISLAISSNDPLKFSICSSIFSLILSNNSFSKI